MYTPEPRAQQRYCCCSTWFENVLCATQKDYNLDQRDTSNGKEQLTRLITMLISVQSVEVVGNRMLDCSINKGPPQQFGAEGMQILIKSVGGSVNLSKFRGINAIRSANNANLHGAFDSFISNCKEVVKLMFGFISNSLKISRTGFSRR